MGGLLRRFVPVRFAVDALPRLHTRWHRLIAVTQIIPIVSILVPAVFAFIPEVDRNLRLLGKEVTFSISGNVGVHTFGMALFAA